MLAPSGVSATPVRMSPTRSRPLAGEFGSTDSTRAWAPPVSGVIATPTRP